MTKVTSSQKYYFIEDNTQNTVLSQKCLANSYDGTLQSPVLLVLLPMSCQLIMEYNSNSLRKLLCH